MVGVEKMKKYQGCCWLCCFWAAFCNYSTFQSGALHTEASWLQPPIVGSTQNGWMIFFETGRISDHHIWGLLREEGLKNLEIVILVHYVCFSLFQFNPTSRLWCLFSANTTKISSCFVQESKKIHLVKFWLKKKPDMCY